MDGASMTTPADPSGEALPVRTVVVGAGLAGLMCARTLVDHGEDVALLDKSRGPGGRTATRRGDGLAWDHGAPVLDLSVDDRLLVRWIASWARDGRIVRWAPDTQVWDGAMGEVTPGEEAWAVVGGANRLARHLASGLDLRVGTEVAGVSRQGAGWVLCDGDGAPVAYADRVVLAMPSPQAARLVRPVSPALASRLASVRYASQWTALLEVDPEDGPEADRIRFVDHPVLAEARHTGAGPGRDARGAWVVHATRSWSSEHLSWTKDAAGEALATALAEAVGDLSVRSIAGHRWRYAQVEVALGGAVAASEDGTLVVCGDGMLGAGVSAALRSGVAAAGFVAGR